MAGQKDEEEQRRSGAVLPWWRAAAGGEGGFGPMGLMRAFGRAFLTAPEATFLRVLAGGLVALGGAWGLAAVAGRSAAADGAPILSPFIPAPAGLSSDSALAGRTDLASLVRGMEGLWGTPPEAVVDAPSSGDGSVPPPDGSPDAAKEGEKKGGAQKAAEDGADSAAAAADAGGGATGGDFVPGASMGGPAAGLGAGDLASAAQGGARPSGGAESAAGGATGAASAMRQMRAGTLRSARTGSARAGKGALSQLKFADKSSQLGASAGSAERSYQAAQSAFEGGATGAGSPIGGAGAGDGGAGVSASPNPRGTIAGPPPGTGPRLSCPPGYTLDGSDCKGLQGVNKTPYQGLADMAKTFMILGAVLAAVGLLLVTRPLPWMQIVGGMMLGAAAALILAALAIGADIKNRYGQDPQKSAIDAAGARAGQGKSP